MDAWPDIDAVARMKAYLLGRDVTDRVIDRFDTLRCPFPAVCDTEARVHHVVSDQTGVVDLENETRLDDGFVLLVQRVGEGLLILFVGVIVVVLQGGAT